MWLSNGALEGEGGSSTTVIVEKHGLEPVRLQLGTVLSTVVPVEEVTLKHCLAGEEVWELEPDTVADGVVKLQTMSKTKHQLPSRRMVLMNKCVPPGRE